MDNNPQFDIAKYPRSPGGDVCKFCQQSIAGVYYRANTSLLCPSCAEKLQRQIPQDSHAAFVRAIIFGLGGFVVGLALYAGFSILTGIEIGYVSLAVGWLVGKAMMMGSRGAGGRRYQIVAVLLTYAAVSMAFIPIVIHYVITHNRTINSQALWKLVPIGLASPFTQLGEGFSGLIGLVILFVGMQFAWKMTRGIQLAIDGPYQASNAAKA